MIGYPLKVICFCYNLKYGQSFEEWKVLLTSISTGLTMFVVLDGLELGGIIMDIIIATLMVAMVMIHMVRVLTGGARKELHILCHLLR